MNSECLENVRFEKLLGIIINRYLSWEALIKCVTNIVGTFETYQRLLAYSNMIECCNTYIS